MSQTITHLQTLLLNSARQHIKLIPMWSSHIIFRLVRTMNLLWSRDISWTSIVEINFKLQFENKKCRMDVHYRRIRGQIYMIDVWNGYAINWCCYDYGVNGKLVFKWKMKYQSFNFISIVDRRKEFTFKHIHLYGCIPCM